MITGMVIGELQSTINHPFYDGQKLMVVALVDFAGQATGDYLVAIDKVSAGIGSHVVVLDEGHGARQICADPKAPVRSAIVAIIDHIALG